MQRHMQELRLNADVPVFAEYDLQRQFDVIRMVGELTSVPVPKVWWSDASGAATGVPLFVMERVDGLVPPDVMPYTFGDNWLFGATPEQQNQLTEQFKTLLIRTYSNALTNYRDNTMSYKPLRMNAGDTEVIVRTEVTRAGQAPVPIDYSMEKTPEGWKAYDVVVAGVSLVTNYRDEFNDAMKSSGVDGLIKTLADKNKGSAPK